MTPAASEPRWRRLPEERPNQILQAALEVFDEQGLAGARLEDIAKRAGVSKGTIYLYFPNKEELFREVVRATVVPAIIEGDQQLLDEGTASDALRRQMRRYWEFSRTRAATTIHRLVIGELHRFPDLSTFYMNDVVMRKRDQVLRILQRGIDSGEFRQVDPAVASRMMGAMYSMHALYCSNRQAFPDLQTKTDDQVFEQIADFYLHALRACPQ